MKTLLGFLLILIGAVVGIYVGGYLLFWNGALGIYHGVVNESFITFMWGLIRFLCSGAVGWGLFYLFTAFGAFLLGD